MDSNPAVDQELGWRRPTLWRRFRDYRYFDEDHLQHRPRFWDLVKALWFNWLCMIICGIAVKMVYDHVPDPTYILFNLFDTSLAKPYQNNPIPFPLDVFLAIGIPLLIILLCVIWTRSIWDLAMAITGLFMAFVVAMLSQVVLKKTVGGLRPHFYDVCRPQVDSSAVTQQHNTAESMGAPFMGFELRYFNSSICSPHASPQDLGTVYTSFPSGHTAALFATMGFVGIYLSYKFDVRSRPNFVKIVLLVMPLLIASIVGGIMLSYGWHHPLDIYAGVILGTLSAVYGYIAAFEGHRPRIESGIGNGDWEEKDGAATEPQDSVV